MFWNISPQDWGDWMRALPLLIFFVASILFVVFVVWCCDPDKFWRRKNSKEIKETKKEATEC